MKRNLIFIVTIAFSMVLISCGNTKNGHEYVDLGLPSGTLWATCNVGANSPEDFGDYFAWGETITKETYNASTYKYSDNPKTLPESADVATVNWGIGWRMPTMEDMMELHKNCTHEWTTQNGVNGMLFTGANGNEVFFPSAGARGNSNLFGVGETGGYWSSSLYAEESDNAYFLCFYLDTSSGVSHINRGFGQTIRPICSK